MQPAACIEGIQLHAISQMRAGGTVNIDSDAHVSKMQPSMYPNACTHHADHRGSIDFLPRTCSTPFIKLTDAKPCPIGPSMPGRPASDTTTLTGMSLIMVQGMTSDSAPDWLLSGLTLPAFAVHGTEQPIMLPRALPKLHLPADWSKNVLGLLHRCWRSSAGGWGCS